MKRFFCLCLCCVSPASVLFCLWYGLFIQSGLGCSHKFTTGRSRKCRTVGICSSKLCAGPELELIASEQPTTHLHTHHCLARSCHALTADVIFPPFSSLPPLLPLLHSLFSPSLSPPSPLHHPIPSSPLDLSYLPPLNVTAVACLLAQLDSRDARALVRRRRSRKPFSPPPIPAPPAPPHPPWPPPPA